MPPAAKICVGQQVGIGALADKLNERAGGAIFEFFSDESRSGSDLRDAVVGGIVRPRRDVHERPVEIKGQKSGEQASRGDHRAADRPGPENGLATPVARQINGAGRETQQTERDDGRGPFLHAGENEPGYCYQQNRCFVSDDVATHGGNTSRQEVGPVPVEGDIERGWCEGRGWRRETSRCGIRQRDMPEYGGEERGPKQKRDAHFGFVPGCLFTVLSGTPEEPESD